MACLSVSVWIQLETHLLYIWMKMTGYLLVYVYRCQETGLSNSMFEENRKLTCPCRNTIEKWLVYVWIRQEKELTCLCMNTTGNGTDLSMYEDDRKRNWPVYVWRRQKKELSCLCMKTTEKGTDLSMYEDDRKRNWPVYVWRRQNLEAAMFLLVDPHGASVGS